MSSINIKSPELVHLKFITLFDLLIDFGTYLQHILQLFNNVEQQSSSSELSTKKPLRKIAKKTTKKTANKSTKKTPKTSKTSKTSKTLKASKKSNIISFSSFWEPDVSKNTNELQGSVREILSFLHLLQEQYYDTISPVFLQQISEESKKGEQFYNLIVSKNIIDQLNKSRNELQSITKKVNNFPDFATIIGNNCNKDILQTLSFEEEILQIISNQVLSKLTFVGTVQKFFATYEENYPDLPQPAPNNEDFCPFCKVNLTLFSDFSEKRCEECGYTEMLDGLVFEDSQSTNPQMSRSKHKKHNPGTHCAKWLYQLQAKENKIIPQKAVDILNKKAIREYTHSGVKRSMSNLKCRQIREWMKTTGLSKLNNHAPLIRKVITGLNGTPVSPPQLSPEEEQMILNDFGKATMVFEKITKKKEVLQIFEKSNIRNKRYYPFFLLKIITRRLKGDVRLGGLIECIHLQSSVTLTKDDLLWKEICAEMGDYHYEPTNRTVLLDIF